MIRMTRKNKNRKILIRYTATVFVCTFIALMIVFAIDTITGRNAVYAVDETVSNQEGANSDSISIGINTSDGNNMATVIRMILILTILSLAPSFLIMLTSFTRVLIVLHFVRTALGTQTAPPNQILAGLALFLTIFIMAPVFTEINETAITPLSKEEMTLEEAIDVGQKPLKEFMLKQVRDKDLKTFIEISKYDTSKIDDTMDIPIHIVIPAFIISELRIAFIIGFLIYIPFLVIDMVVSSTLMSMGMMMLPPTTISLPFKILLFVLADGWDLVIGNVVRTFY